jgi:hypothetical protein
MSVALVLLEALHDLMMRRLALSTSASHENFEITPTKDDAGTLVALGSEQAPDVVTSEAEGEERWRSCKICKIPSKIRRATRRLFGLIG